MKPRRRCSAADAENLVVGAGGVADAVRTEERWRAEPPGQAVAAARLVEGTELGAAPPRRHPAGPLPAAGLLAEQPGCGAGQADGGGGFTWPGPLSRYGGDQAGWL